MSPALIMARARRGVVGETRRVVHLFPASASAHRLPLYLVALCGATFAPGQLDQLDEPCGMPCELCLSRLPGPTAALHPSEDRPVSHPLGDPDTAL
ncbi:MAG: hypothetical protein ACRDQ1_02415 [Sciscionella sp.]